MTDGIFLSFAGKRLNVISIYDQKYHTEKGLRVGSSTNDLVAWYGKPDEADPDTFDYRKLGLQISCKGGVVVMIHVVDKE